MLEHQNTLLFDAKHLFDTKTESEIPLTKDRISKLFFFLKYTQDESNLGYM